MTPSKRVGVSRSRTFGESTQPYAERRKCRGSVNFISTVRSSKHSSLMTTIYLDEVWRLRKVRRKLINRPKLNVEPFISACVHTVQVPSCTLSEVSEVFLTWERRMESEREETDQAASTDRDGTGEESNLGLPRPSALPSFLRSGLWFACLYTTRRRGGRNWGRRNNHIYKTNPDHCKFRIYGRSQGGHIRFAIATVDNDDLQIDGSTELRSCPSVCPFGQKRWE